MKEISERLLDIAIAVSAIVGTIAVSTIITLLL
jgi:hypothetical protein